MHLTIAPPTAGSARRASGRTSSSSQFAVEEVNAYIAVRDGLLKEAEQSPSAQSIERLKMANEFVVSCLRPAKQPYALQAIPELDAARELKRCHSIATRVTKLQAALVAAA